MTNKMDNSSLLTSRKKVSIVSRVVVLQYMIIFLNRFSYSIRFRGVKSRGPGEWSINVQLVNSL